MGRRSQRDNREHLFRIILGFAAKHDFMRNYVFDIFLFDPLTQTSGAEFGCRFGTDTRIAEAAKVTQIYLTVPCIQLSGRLNMQL